MYATLDDMETRYSAAQLIQLTDDAGAGVINVAAVQAALDDAAVEINSYVAAVYALPLTQPEPNLTRYACDVAFYFLHRDLAPEAVKDRYDAAIAWLKLLAQGKTRLTANGGIEAPAAANTILTEPNLVADRRDRMRGF